MSRARDYRRDENGRAVDPFLKRKRRFKPVLRLLGAEELFAATPRGFQEALWRGKRPEPRAVAQDGVEPWAETVVNRAFVETDVAYGDGRVTFADLVAVILPLRATLRHVGTGANVLPSVRRLIERALPGLDRICDEHATGLYERVCGVAAKVAVACGEAASAVVWWRMDQPTPDEVRKTGVEVVLGRDVPEAVHVRVDGSNRPAYRVGCLAPTGERTGVTVARWVSVPASVFGDAGAGELPVYAQAHALRQMHERLDLPRMRPWAEFFLAQSLIEPKVARGCGGGDVLVEYRFDVRKVGYLVLSRVGDRALVRTFLLLTMAGTPEGDRLGRRLRLTRDEARWLGLHRLSSLAASDVRDDAELVAILAECGCGQLAEVARGVDFITVATGYAAELRKYIGLASAAAVENAGAAEAAGDGEDAEGQDVRAAA
jgi:hypothetical protein